MSTKTVNICETHEKLADLIELAQEGTEVILAYGTKPLARLVPVETPQLEAEPIKKKRILGLHEGQTWMSDDFNDPLPDEFWGGRV